jgi:hypothetical protein
MNSNSANKKSGQMTPGGLKKTLIAMLILSAIAGHASTICFSLRTTSGAEILIPHQVTRPLLDTLKAPENLKALVTENIEQFQGKHISGVKDLFRGIAEPKGTLHSFTFQGTLTGTQGAVAIINDRPVAVDAEIDGIRIAAISDRMVILEYQQNTKEVLVGETVSVYIDD